MNIVLLYSDLDNFIVTCIVLITVLMFLMNWIREKFKSVKSSTNLFQDDEMVQNLDNYTLSFEINELAVKQFGVKTKMTSVLISLIIVTIPLYEFIETLRPQELYFFGWGCLI